MKENATRKDTQTDGGLAPVPSEQGAQPVRVLVGLQMNQELHRRAKAEAARQGARLYRFVELAVEEKLERAASGERAS